MRRGMKLVFVGLCFCMLFVGSFISAKNEEVDFSKFTKPIPINMNEVKLTQEDLPEGYSFHYEVICYSFQAGLYFNNPSFYDFFLGTTFVKKEFQSIKGPEGDQGSILYIQYKNDLDKASIAFLQGMIWGEDGPTNLHPEDIFINGKNVIIWSFKRDSLIKRISQQKLHDVLLKK